MNWLINVIIILFNLWEYREDLLLLPSENENVCIFVYPWRVLKIFVLVIYSANIFFNVKDKYYKISPYPKLKDKCNFLKRLLWDSPWSLNFKRFCFYFFSPKVQSLKGTNRRTNKGGWIKWMNTVPVLVESVLEHQSTPNVHNVLKGQNVSPIIFIWIMNLIQLYSNWGAYDVHKLQIFSLNRGF